MNNMQPYQILFPIGALYAISGALVWILFAFGWIAYPGTTHAHWMVGGFLFSFVMGFLMTAIPKFTGSHGASQRELQFACVLALASFALMNPLRGQAMRYGIALSILLFLCFYGGRRFRARLHSPPKHFVFLLVGLISGIVGSAMLLGTELTGTFTELTLPARILLYQGTIFCFVLGVGGKLITALLGWDAGPMIQITSLQKTRTHPITQAFRSAITWQVALVVFSFAIEFTPLAAQGRLIRAFVASWIALSKWQIHRAPRVRGRLTNWLWISTWGLISGLWIYALIPAAGIHGLHLAYISGFGLMTLMVASRVTLAHGGYGMELELRSRAIRWTGGLIVFAAMTRFVAPWTSSYSRHLAYAAVTWIAALLIWIVVFTPKAINPRGNSEHP